MAWTRRSRVTLENQARVDADLRAVGDSSAARGTWIESTKRVSVAAAMLVIALARNDEGERRHLPGG